jgi:hypothetical protein
MNYYSLSGFLDYRCKTIEFNLLSTYNIPINIFVMDYKILAIY